MNTDIRPSRRRRRAGVEDTPVRSRRRPFGVALTVAGASLLALGPVAGERVHADEPVGAGDGGIEEPAAATATLIHDCADTQVIAGAVVHNPTDQPVSFLIAVQSNKVGAGWSVTVPPGGTDQRTVPVHYAALVAVTVSIDGNVLLHQPQVASTGPGACMLPVPPTGAGLSFDLQSGCDAGAYRYDLHISNATGSTVPLQISVDVDEDESLDGTRQVGASDVVTMAVSTGQAVRFEVLDAFNREVYDSGLLVSDVDCQQPDPTTPTTGPTETGDPVPSETVPSETVPSETVPAETVPADTVPSGADTPTPTTPTPTTPTDAAGPGHVDQASDGPEAPAAPAPTTVATPTVPTFGELPVTGRGSVPVSALGGLLLTAGILLVRLARRGGIVR